MAKFLLALEVVDVVVILRKRILAVGKFVVESGVIAEKFSISDLYADGRGRKVFLRTEDYGVVEGLRSNRQKDLLSQLFLFLGLLEM